jgi:hypothetical protein
MRISRNTVDTSKFNRKAQLSYELRLKDFEMAMQDVYDFLFDVNSQLSKKGLQRLDDMLRPAIMSGVLSDMITASMGKTLPNARGKQIFQRPPGPHCAGSLFRQCRQGERNFGDVVSICAFMSLMSGMSYKAGEIV